MQELKLGWNLEAGAEAEAMEDAAYWLVPQLVQSAFLQNSRPAAQGVPTHICQGPPSFFSN